MAKDKSILTPQQILFLQYYTDPKSETFSNALQSALRAEYTQEYAESITAKGLDWLSENSGDVNRLKKAEKNLTEVQELNIISTDGKVMSDVLRERTKVDMFVAGTLGKHKYSTKGDDAMSKIAEKIEAINYIIPSDAK